MSFIQRELNRISIALREPCSADVYDRLYAAQNALAWALEPNVIAAPFSVITHKGEDLIGCLSSSHQGKS
jgi:hypothetical protein